MFNKTLKFYAPFSTIDTLCRIFLGLFCGWNSLALETGDFDSALRLGDIMVTTEKNPDTVQNIPLSISVLPKKRLESAGIHSMKDASYLIPNLYLSEFSSRRTSFPFFRGLGSGQGEPVVSTIIDGVPQLTANTTNIDLLEIERIEFVRGPQGSLYGRNTLGGIIHIVTQKPSGKKEFNSRIRLGEFNLKQGLISLQTPMPVAEGFLGLTGSYLKRDGFVKNETTGKSVDDRESLSGRLSIRILPSKHLEVTLTGFGERDRDGPFTLFDLDQLKKTPYRIQNDFQGITDRNIASPTLTLTYYGEEMDFSSITGYTFWDATDETDLDFTNLDAQRRTTDEKNHQFYQELRIGSSEDAILEIRDSLSLRWLLGISFFYSDFDHESVNEFGSQWPFGPQNDFIAKYHLNDLGSALFGQGTIHIKDRLRLTLGLRLDYERRESRLDLAPIKENLDENFFNVLPKFGLAYQVTKQINLYTYAAKGFRAGGYNRNPVPNGEFEVDEEKSWTFELGMKTSWLQDRVRVNIATFYIDWDDMQLDVPDPNFPGVFFLDNAGESSSKGFELEVAAKPHPNLDFFAGFGYTDAEFKEYIDPFTGNNVENNELPNAPKVTWNLGVQSQLDLMQNLQLTVHLDVSGVGEVKFDSANTRHQNDYLLSNFKVGLAGDTWSIEGWIRNIFDEEFIVLALPSNFSPSGFAGQSGTPQMVGVHLKFRM